MKFTTQELKRVNTELWLILSLFVLAAGVNFLVASHHMVLGFYSLPTIFSAYTFGRRHAVLTAFASVFMVGLVLYRSPHLMQDELASRIFFFIPGNWLEIVVWGGTLVVTAYLMGALYERQKEQMKELRQTYNGVLLILQQFISKDKYTQNHSYRVSVYATTIASAYGLDPERIEDVRAAALLHDIGKLEISREILYKAASLSAEEFDEMRTHVVKGARMLQPVGGSLRRVLPIILAHHEKFDGSGYNPVSGEAIPLEARIISVADAYDAMTSDRPYRKAMSPFDAKEVIERGAGKEFDPDVVGAFMRAFRKQELEVPEVLV
ncbi:MAG TPA: HD-GYP domain-containing protein [Terriglobales bacterium]|nr:HD-GYP domain-containing protein [Terriglobales bacterium]